MDNCFILWTVDQGNPMVPKWFNRYYVWVDGIDEPSWLSTPKSIADLAATGFLIRNFCLSGLNLTPVSHLGVGFNTSLLAPSIPACGLSLILHYAASKRGPAHEKKKSLSITFSTPPVREMSIRKQVIADVPLRRSGSLTPSVASMTGTRLIMTTGDEDDRTCTTIGWNY
jgi:hypothetical protein